MSCKTIVLYLWVLPMYIKIVLKCIFMKNKLIITITITPNIEMASNAVNDEIYTMFLGTFLISDTFA